MSTINGLPAHVLFVHFIVVVAPLTSILLIVCSLWRPARHRLTWLTVVLATSTVVLTPLTTDAGEWLEKHVGRSAALHNHTQLGDTMLYFAVALLIAAVLLAVVHVREERAKPVKRVVVAAVALVAILAGVAATVQVYRIGDSGARATWGDQIATSSGG